MIWHPPFSPALTTLLVLLGLGVMAVSFLWPRKQLNPLSPMGLATIALRSAGFLVLLFVLLQPSRMPPPRTITTQRTLAVLIDTSGSMSVHDEVGGPLRIDQATHMLADHKLIDLVTNQAKAKLAVYGFDAQAMPLKPEGLSQLKAEGKQTDIGAALEQVVNRHQGDDLAGVLLLTDGRNNQGADPRTLVKKLKTPVFPLPIGQPRKPDVIAAEAQRKDLAVDAVSAAPRVILGRAVQVAASVRSQGYGARQVTVQLLENDVVIATSAVAVSPQQPKRQALFTLKPTSLGVHGYQVRIPKEDDDADPTNNASAFKVEVVDPINRLLYLDRLRQERKFLKAVIDAQKNLRFTAIVQQDEKHVLIQGNDTQMRADAATLSADQLRGLKAVILGDLPASTLQPEQIAALAKWVDDGGALLLLAGPASLGAAGFESTPLAKILPIAVAPGQNYVEQEYRVALTPDGAAHPAFQKVGANWAPAAPLLTVVKIASVKPAATVLLQQAEAPHAPVCVSHTYGHGKVAVVLTDSTWRWQLAATRTRGGESTEHAVFWQQMIDWLMPQLQQQGGDAGVVQLITDRTEYEVNQAVTMMASVRGGDGAVLTQAKVEFVVASPDGRPIQRAGTLDAGGGQAFGASFDAYAAGEYAVQAVAKLDGRTIGTDDAKIRVVQPVVEFLQTDPDRGLLEDLAKLSGGKCLDAAALDQLPALAKLAPREVQLQPNGDEEAEPVWNRWWLLAAFVVLMSGEWLLRRRNQWV